MPFTIKLLDHGISNGSTKVLYTVDASALGAIVSNVRLVNTGGSAAAVNLYYKPNGGSQVRILDRDKSIPASEIVVVKPELTMAASDKIELVTTSTSVEFVVSGMERV